MPYGFGSLSYSKNGKERWIWTKNRRHYGSGSHRQGRSAIICGITKAPDESRKTDADASRTARNIKNFIDIAEEAHGFLRSNCRKTKVYIFSRTRKGLGNKGSTHLLRKCQPFMAVRISCGVGFPTGIRSRNSLPTRKTARFKAFLCRWNVLFIHTGISSKS